MPTDSLTAKVPRFDVFVPILPRPALSPNVRAHWSARYRAGKELKEFVMVAVLARIRQEGWVGLPMQHAEASVELRLCRKRSLTRGDGYLRPRDPDNASAALKPAFDGLKLAGVIVDDDAAHFTLKGVAIVEVETTQAEGIAFALREVT